MLYGHSMPPSPKDPLSDRCLREPDPHAQHAGRGRHRQRRLPPPGPVGGRFPTVERFVDQAYLDVFGRPADPAGLTYWTGRIEAGASSAALYQELVASPEFAGTVAPIVRLYLSVLDRQPDLPGLRYWIERRRQGASHRGHRPRLSRRQRVRCALRRLAATPRSSRPSTPGYWAANPTLPASPTGPAESRTVRSRCHVSSPR